MVDFRDFFDAFKGSMPGGETAVGTWLHLEKHGRFSGMGEAEAQIDLPKGKAVISNEEIREVAGFEIEVSDPDGNPVPLERISDAEYLTEAGMHNLIRIAVADVQTPGPHRIRVKGTDPAQELVILVGKDSITEARR